MNQTNIVMHASSILLGVMLVGVGTAMLNMPQMVGLANAQSERASEQACPQGFTLSQGRCTAPQPTSLECAPIAGMEFNSKEGNICVAVGNVTAPTFGTFRAGCTAALGTLDTSSFQDFALCRYPTTAVPTGICPTGTTAIGGQCVIRPGSVNRP